jgi:hypothetical protein
MILLLAVAAGLVASLARAWIKKRRLQYPNLRLFWLVLLAVIPQLLIFHIPLIAQKVHQSLAAYMLVGSQLLLLIFVWANRTKPGFWMLGLGLALNLLVIVFNGGLMPISPETMVDLVPDTSYEIWEPGNRLGSTKDIILPIAETHLWCLSDRFVVPKWFPYRVAFSLGDVLIAFGVFWALWVLGE